MTETHLALLVGGSLIYALTILLSVYILTDVPEELEHNPGLINRKWKRALWVMGCLVFLPILIVASRGPRSICREIKEFIIAANGEKNDGEAEDKL